MTVTTVEDRDRAPSGEAGRARAWAAVCIAAASAFLYVADSAFVSLAIPQIEATFPSVPRARIGWVATAFMVTQASLLLIAGRLGDRRGRRRYFVLGLTAYGVGAAIALVISLIAAIEANLGIALLAESSHPDPTGRGRLTSRPLRESPAPIKVAAGLPTARETEPPVLAFVEELKAAARKAPEVNR